MLIIRGKQALPLKFTTRHIVPALLTDPRNYDWLQKAYTRYFYHIKSQI
ncbi:hypothetical protein GF323_01000 [Candidatus Woesearchaeota archaeon]|nr:hypothetical protein [Candidatus Woesearchaeota archaeon]